MSTNTKPLRVTAHALDRFNERFHFEITEKEFIGIVRGYAEIYSMVDKGEPIRIYLDIAGVPCVVILQKSNQGFGIMTIYVNEHTPLGKAYVREIKKLSKEKFLSNEEKKRRFRVIRNTYEYEGNIITMYNAKHGYDCTPHIKELIAETDTFYIVLEYPELKDAFDTVHADIVRLDKERGYTSEKTCMLDVIPFMREKQEHLKMQIGKLDERIARFIAQTEEMED